MLPPACNFTMLHEEVLPHFKFKLSTLQARPVQVHIVIYGPMNSVHLSETREHNLWHDAAV